MLDISEIVDAVEKIRGKKGVIDLSPYRCPSDISMNEYCLFIKPEILRSPKSKKCIESIIEILSNFNQVPSSCRIIGSNYLVENKIMQQHYGVIDAVSRGGLGEISDEARGNLDVVLQSKNIENPEILGAHQFLEKYPSFNAESLAILYDGLDNNRLAGGTHCVVLNIRGKPTVLFNGFHPEQLENYTRNNSVIVVFTIAAQTSKHCKLNQILFFK